MKSTL